MTTTVLKQRATKKTNGEAPPGARAGIYGRLSRVEADGTEEKTSRQLDDGVKHCQQKGWEVVGTFVDADYSGYDLKLVRPDFEALLSEIESGAIDVVIVWKFDRLTRQPPHLERFLQLIEAKQCRLVSLTEPLPFGAENTTALMMLRQLVSWANYESSVKAERQVRANRARAENGEPWRNGGYRCFGFKEDGVTQIPKEAALVREAAQRVLDGWSLAAICRDWKERGIETPTRTDGGKGKVVDRQKPGRPRRRAAHVPGRWRPTSLRYMLLTPKQAGLRAYHYDPTTGEVDFLVKGKWKPILEQHVWEQVCTILRDRRERRAPLSGAYLLPGLIWCGSEDCQGGSRLISRPAYNSKGERIPRYHCPGKNDPGRDGCGSITVRAKFVEEEVASRLMAVISKSKKFRAKVEGWEVDDERQKAVVAELGEIDERLKEADHDHRILGRGDLGHLPRDRYLKVVDELEKRKGALRRQLRTGAPKPMLKELLDDPAAVWESWSFDERRRCLEEAVEKIVIRRSSARGGKWDPERVEVTWKV